LSEPIDSGARTCSICGFALPTNNTSGAHVACRRGHVKTSARSRTIAPRKLSRAERVRGEKLVVLDVRRPTIRAECVNDERPCPFVSCKHHLYLDVNPETGSIKLNFPDLEVHELPESCALDIADQGGRTLEHVGEILNLTRERIRQVEVRALLKLKMDGEP
jgi:hypothetical protein